MNEEVICICKQLQQEAQTVIDYMQNISAITRTGTAQSISNVQVFNDLVIENVAHCQSLAIALASCFYQDEDKEESKD